MLLAFFVCHAAANHKQLCDVLKFFCTLSIQGQLAGCFVVELSTGPNPIGQDKRSFSANR